MCGVRECEQAQMSVSHSHGAQTMEIAIWQIAFPAVFMIVTLFCFNYIGDGLRDALDPKDR